MTALLLEQLPWVESTAFARKYLNKKSSVFLFDERKTLIAIVAALTVQNGIE